MVSVNGRLYITNRKPSCIPSEYGEIFTKRRIQDYKDKFLEKNVFQWETIHDISESELQKQKNCKYVYLFVRKVESENGITLPHTYIGKGVLTNPRKTDGSNGTYIYDIKMENDLPEYL